MRRYGTADRYPIPELVSGSGRKESFALIDRSTHEQIVIFSSVRLSGP
jgi:hypothetical protein